MVQRNRNVILLLLSVVLYLGQTEWTILQKETQIYQNSQIKRISRLEKQWKIVLEVFPNNDFSRNNQVLLTLSGVTQIAHNTHLQILFRAKSKWVTLKPVKTNSWTKIEVSQTLTGCQYLSEIYIDDTRVHSEANTRANAYANVNGKVNSQAGFHIRNLVIETSDTGKFKEI